MLILTTDIVIADEFYPPSKVITIVIHNAEIPRVRRGLYLDPFQRQENDIVIPEVSLAWKSRPKLAGFTSDLRRVNVDLPGTKQEMWVIDNREVKGEERGRDRKASFPIDVENPLLRMIRWFEDAGKSRGGIKGFRWFWLMAFQHSTHALLTLKLSVSFLPKCPLNAAGCIHVYSVNSFPGKADDLILLEIYCLQ
ncbi:uncharacterized protein BDR25DRAFT_348959 [Lindgomyces ingoldianus]|uniref:Uncharacterized protein n=1 Tax=Lindgomyces ingoldianus TaxID=673940 RepID=A0ACB6RCT1_9PLEO|nr:uncharacterized protein BDR25DRAFT_348959 [Lindgomyces ingoldianus]KAF2477069.1 hypothetical protein BDR25DRAFT_348959 [Lindgomyces ingoldianus]